MTSRKQRILVTAASVAVFITMVSPAGAVPVPLGGGWEAEVLNGATASFVVDPPPPGAIAIEISKDFTQGPGIGGVFPSILIQFRQIDTDANTVDRIIITQEAITNLTGAAWTDFHWALLDMGQASFNPNLTNFDTTPFTNQTFANFLDSPTNQKPTEFNVDGGVVPDSGFTWFPSGELVIDVDLSNPSMVNFNLKEFPTPEPASIALLALGSVALLRRKR
jgi:hypothetical protein